jgi:hypothetical protein
MRRRTRGVGCRQTVVRGRLGNSASFSKCQTTSSQLGAQAQQSSSPGGTTISGPGLFPQALESADLLLGNALSEPGKAGCGQGKDEPPLDDANKVHWRKQAMDWLKADLGAWSKNLDSGNPQARPTITQALQHWKADADLAGIREPAALAKLPADEQNTCRALWSQVDAMLSKSQATNHRPGEVGNR